VSHPSWHGGATVRRTSTTGTDAPYSAPMWAIHAATGRGEALAACQTSWTFTPVWPGHPAGRGDLTRLGESSDDGGRRPWAWPGDRLPLHDDGPQQNPQGPRVGHVAAAIPRGHGVVHEPLEPQPVQDGPGRQKRSASSRPTTRGADHRRPGYPITKCPSSCAESRSGTHNGHGFRRIPSTNSHGHRLPGRIAACAQYLQSPPAGGARPRRAGQVPTFVRSPIQTV